MVCCVTGHRPDGFPFPHFEGETYFRYLAALEAEVETLIREGYTEMITGMAMGADLDFGYAVLECKKRHPEVTLEAAVPCPEQTRGWPRRYLSQYEYVLARCDKQTLVSPTYDPGCMQRRNRYMVDNADLVLAIWNGNFRGGTWNAISYAKKENCPVKYMMLYDFM